MMFSQKKHIGAKRLRTIVSLVVGLLVLVGCYGQAMAELPSEDLWKTVKERGTLRMMIAPCPPYSYKDPATREWKGVDVEIFKELCRQIGVEPVIIEGSWATRTPGLQAHKWDTAAAANRTVRRTLAVNFSVPYTETEVGLSYRKDNAKIPPNPVSLENFDKKGIVFCTAGGTVYDHVLTPILKNAEIIRVVSSDEVRMAVLTGRADVGAIESLSAKLFAEAIPEIETCLPEPPVFKQGMSFLFRETVPQGQIEAFDILIEQLRWTGQIERWKKEHAETLIKSFREMAG